MGSYRVPTLSSSTFLLIRQTGLELLRESWATGERVILREHHAPRSGWPRTGAWDPLLSQCGEAAGRCVSEGRSATPAAGLGVCVRFRQTTDHNRNN